MMVETGVVRVGISAPTYMYLLALDLYCPGILCTLHYTIGITNGEQVYISDAERAYLSTYTVLGT